MKIGIYFPDYRPEDGGANTLLGTILKEIENSKSCNYDFVVLYKGKTNKVEYKNGIKYIDLGYLFGTNVLSKGIRTVREKILNYSILDKVAKREKIDLYYFPEHPNVNVSVPYIYTVWDLGHRTVPQYPEVSANGIWLKREKLYQKMLPKASYIITGNNTGKKEIMNFYDVESNKIKVCEFPISDFCFGSETKPSFINSKDFFFYPAQFWAHKNHTVIIKAIKYLKDVYDAKPIVYFTGSDKGNLKEVKKEIVANGLEDQIIITGFISNEELKYLYTHAIGMIFASMMGPNNMPPIEATYLNCPVIITNLEGHIEQLGDTALYFDGNDYIKLAEHIRNIRSNKVERDKILESQKPLREKFSKINYFEEVMKIFDEYYLIKFNKDEKSISRSNLL